MSLDLREALPSSPPARGPRHFLPAWMLSVGACCAYMPLGLQYLAFLSCLATALVWMGRAGRLGAVASHPLFVVLLAFWLWMLGSALWSVATARDIVAHLWTYALPLAVVPLAMAMRADQARRALGHFIVASALVGVAYLLTAGGSYGTASGWRPFVDVTGNQRIAFSLLLAVATVLAGWRALEPGVPLQRVAWVLAAACSLAGLLAQDRRTGLMALPLLVAVAAWESTGGRRLQATLRVGLCGAATVALLCIPVVQERFAEGVQELQAPRQGPAPATSWGMRLRMAELTLGMAAEQPLAGHGVGSWPAMWRQRIAEPGPLREHTTPHSEWLLIAVQGGVIGLALAMAAVGTAWRGLRTASSARVPALLLLVTLAWSCLSNAALRDAKFSLPLLTLAALAWASLGTRGDIIKREHNHVP